LLGVQGVASSNLAVPTNFKSKSYADSLRAEILRQGVNPRNHFSLFASWITPRPFDPSRTMPKTQPPHCGCGRTRGQVTMFPYECVGHITIRVPELATVAPLCNALGSPRTASWQKMVSMHHLLARSVISHPRSTIHLPYSK